MIDVGDDIIVVVPRVDDRKKAISVAMVRAYVISVGKAKVAYAPKYGGMGKALFVSRNRVFEDPEQLDEALSCAGDLADELGVAVEVCS